MSTWIQYTTARSFASWKPTSITSGLIRGMSRFSSYTIMLTHIHLNSQQHSCTSLVDLFSHIQLIRLKWHPVIFVYSCVSKISRVAIILQMIWRWNERLQKFLCMYDKLSRCRNGTSGRSIQKMSQFWHYVEKYEGWKKTEARSQQQLTILTSGQWEVVGQFRLQCIYEMPGDLI